MSTQSLSEVKREPSQSRTAKWGWGILLGMSALLTYAGLSWYFGLPQMALENIAEYASLEPGVFMQGKPSAFDIITLIARGYGAGYAALGLFALIIALEGYRHGTRWAWMAMWVLVAAYAALAFTMSAEPFGLVIFFFAAVALVGQLLARRGLAS